MNLKRRWRRIMLRRSSNDRRSERQSRRSEATASGPRRSGRVARIAKGHATIRKNWATTRTNGSERRLEFSSQGSLAAVERPRCGIARKKNLRNASLTRPLCGAGWLIADSLWDDRTIDARP